MKALILSVSAGGGHTHAAESVEKYILANNPESKVKTIDTIRYINPILDKVVIGSYLKSLKFNPSIYGKLYNFAENGESLASVSNKINEIMIYKLIPLIEEFQPDIIISTHAFSAEMASLLKSKGKIHVPIVVILTDYAPHSFWIHKAVDAYIVSNEDMIEDMVARGVTKDIIYNLGIPINPNFFKKFNRAETLKSLNLDVTKLTFLLMGGSLGIGKIYDVYNELQQIEHDIQIIAITGKNKKLFYQLLDQKCTAKKETRVIGYTEEVNKYMQASDLLITKPGGLTITEALISNIPLAIFSAIPGQEEKNAQFLFKHNLAVNLEAPKHCSHVLNALLSTPSELTAMQSNCIKYAKPNSGNDIYKLLLKLIDKSQKDK
jgi:processive 1,2-diacylglycerol beta-glucosyltransferase